MDGDVSPGSIRLTNVSLNYCIRWAYDVKDYQIIGPEWARFAVRYDIAAKAGSPAPEKQLKLVLRQLLAERFKFVLHHDKRELPAYALRIEKGGTKWRTSTGKNESTFKSSGHAYRAENLSIPRLLVFLEPPAGVSRPVVDQTGLEGNFDFTLDLSRYLLDERGKPMLDARGRLDYEQALMRGLSQQLGLKLEPIKAPFDALVIDHAEKSPAQD